MYADDTLIVSKSKDIRSVTSEIQCALVKLFNWCNANKLSINLSKTKHMTILYTKPDLEPAVHVNNKCISTVQSYEYLEMILDNRLTMNDHIDNMWKKSKHKGRDFVKNKAFYFSKNSHKYLQVYDKAPSGLYRFCC